MKYQFKDELTDSFDVYDSKPDLDSRVRENITTGLLVLLAVVVLGGMVYSFIYETASIIEAILDAITNFVAIALGYFFGKSAK